MRNRQLLSDYENHFSDLDFSDIVLLHNGHERCAPGKVDGPHVHNHYLFHLILSGSGALTLDRRTYPLSAGQGFFLSPGQLFRHQADATTPWEYLWVGFAGESVPKLLYSSWLTHTQPVYASPNWRALEAYMLEGFEAARGDGIAAAVRCQGLLYMCLAHLLEETRLFAAGPNVAQLTSIQQQYIQAAIAYMRSNVGRHFTVRDVAASLGLNRSYFSRLFTSICGCSPAAFIGNYRLDLAWHMIRYADMPIHQVALSVGFEETAYFTRRFVERYGKTPSQIRATGNVRP